MENEKMTKQMAEDEFLAWCEANELETDVAEMTDTQKTVYESFKKSFVKCLRSGRIVVDGIDFEYTVSKFSPEGFAGTKLKITRPGGNVFLGMDGRKETESHHKTQQGISALIGKDVGWIAKLDASDWSFLSQAVAIFL